MMRISAPHRGHTSENLRRGIRNDDLPGQWGFAWHEFGAIRVKGRTRPVRVFEPLAAAGQENTEQKMRAAAHAEALEGWRARFWRRGRTLRDKCRYRSPVAAIPEIRNRVRATTAGAGLGAGDDGDISRGQIGIAARQTFRRRRGYFEPPILCVPLMLSVPEQSKSPRIAHVPVTVTL